MLRQVQACVPRHANANHTSVLSDTQCRVMQPPARMVSLKAPMQPTRAFSSPACPCCNTQHAADACCCGVPASHMHSPTSIGLHFYFCGAARCDYAVSLEQGQQVYCFEAECRAAALHRAKTGVAGPACVGITDQQFAYLFDSPSFGQVNISQLEALQPGLAFFPVLRKLLQSNAATAASACSQVRLYRGDSQCLRSPLCTGQAADASQPTEPCVPCSVISMNPAVRRRAAAKQKLLSAQHDLVSKGITPALPRGQPASMTHAETQLHMRQLTSTKRDQDAALRVSSLIRNTHWLQIHVFRKQYMTPAI